LRSGLFRRAFKLIEGRSANFAGLRVADRRNDSIDARAFEALSQPRGERLEPLLVLARHVLGFARRVGVAEIENRHADLVSLHCWRALSALSADKRKQAESRRKRRRGSAHHDTHCPDDMRTPRRYWTIIGVDSSFDAALALTAPRR